MQQEHTHVRKSFRGFDSGKSCKTWGTVCSWGSLQHLCSSSARCLPSLLKLSDCTHSRRSSGAMSCSSIYIPATYFGHFKANVMFCNQTKLDFKLVFQRIKLATNKSNLQFLRFNPRENTCVLLTLLPRQPMIPRPTVENLTWPMWGTSSLLTHTDRNKPTICLLFMRR